MPKQINAETDMEILKDLSMGIKNIEIAKKYDVSPSYVSKVKTGKKKLNIYVPTPKVFSDLDISAFEDSLEGIKKMIKNSTVLVDKKDIITYLEAQVNKHLLRAKVYVELLEKYKGDEK